MAIFQRLDLPSTINRQDENGAYSETLFKPEEFENVAIFQWLDLPSTINRQDENGAYSETIFKPEEFANAGFAF